MGKNSSYYRLEEKISSAHLKGLSNIRTFKMGLDLSDLAMRMLACSFKGQSHASRPKIRLNTLGAFLRKI
jgi:hypothetical protein